jgi:hypothetical protein
MRGLTVAVWFNATLELPLGLYYMVLQCTGPSIAEPYRSDPLANPPYVRVTTKLLLSRGRARPERKSTPIALRARGGACIGA